MNQSPKILNQEEIKTINAQIMASMERGRETLAQSRERRAQVGLTPENVKKVYDALAPADRAFIDKAVSLGVAELNAATKPASTHARKPRQMV